VQGRLTKIAAPVWSPDPTVCVVMASGGYPGSYEKGKVISGLEEVAQMQDVKVFHAGTARTGDQFITAGGRVLGVTARGRDIPGAISRAYEAVGKITWDGVHYRQDIGKKALHR
jgi:phosphoribosylamine---glycine ligase